MSDVTTESKSDVALPASPTFTLNEAQAFFDSDAYREMVGMVARAQRSIRLEFFLFGGPVADTIIDHLKRKAAEGVQVRVTLDRARGILPAVRRECHAAYCRLLAERIDVALSDPRPFPGTGSRSTAVDHRKILVIDDTEALVGGTNVGSLFFRHHDVMIYLKGPAAAELGRQFDYDRQFALDARIPRPDLSTAPLPPFGTRELPVSLESCTRLLGTGVGRRSTKDALLQNLRAARFSVCVAMSEMGSSEVLTELISAANKRGVAVRVLLDPQDMREYLPPFLGDLRRFFPKTVLNARALRTLLDAGIPVRLFEVGKDFALLHLKMAIFDETSAIVGSTNWTRGGFEWVGEADVELHGGLVIKTLLSRFNDDWQTHSTPARMPPRWIQNLCALWERVAQ